MTFVHLQIIKNVYMDYMIQLVNLHVFCELLDEYMPKVYVQSDPKPMRD